MIRISKRLQAIVSFVSSSDSLVDVGCDHGLLSIYLYENKMVKKVIASDINENALSSAINNIKIRGYNIETVLSDGIKNINLKGINTLVISGMGTGTILHILEDNDKLKKINKLIIQSNNDYKELRQSLNDKGYYLEDEIYTKERNKWYVTCKFVKSSKKNTLTEIKYGFLNNDLYNDYLIEREMNIYKKIPITSLKAKLRLLRKIKEIKKVIRK